MTLVVGAGTGRVGVIGDSALAAGLGRVDMSSPVQDILAASCKSGY